MKYNVYEYRCKCGNEFKLWTPRERAGTACPKCKRKVGENELIRKEEK